MKNEIHSYIIDLYNDVPVSVYEVLLHVFCIGAVLLFSLYGIKKGSILTTYLLLIEYLLLIYCSTVFFRSRSGFYGHNFTPFWSYVAIYNGKHELLPENMMNVLTFVPIGFLFGSVFRRIKWWIVLLVGISISFSIEILQYYFKNGFSEVDDVIHNTLGCMFGFGFYTLLRYGYEKFAKRRMAVL